MEHMDYGSTGEPTWTLGMKIKTDTPIAREGVMELEDRLKKIKSEHGKGIRFRGLSIPECQKVLPAATPGGEPLVAIDLSDEPACPEYVNWCERGVVAHAFGQKQYPNCWACAVASTIQSLVAIKTGKRVRLSIQNLVDCVAPKIYGGLQSKGFLCVMRHGIADEKEYPYKGPVEECKKVKPVVLIEGFSWFKECDEEAMKLVVAKHPIAVVISVCDGFQDYEGLRVFIKRLMELDAYS
ncbi:hypothetical protein ACFE04_028318 [Oxalis oulophora]